VIASNSTPRAPRLIMLTACYIAAYAIASCLDLFTTDLALTIGHAHEGNAFVAHGAAYDAARARLLTGIAGALLAAYFAFGAANRDRISDRWLDRPLRSFLSWRSNPLFVIPWSRHAMDRSPLHAMSFTLAFVALRMLAAANNIMITAFGHGPLGMAVEAVAGKSSPMVGFLAIIGPIYVCLVLLTANFVAWTVKEQRRAASGAVAVAPCKKFNSNPESYDSESYGWNKTGIESVP
jgi:hypothetical protein